MERMVWVTAAKDKIKPLRVIVEGEGGEVLGVSTLHDGRRTLSFLLDTADRQKIMDRIQRELGRGNDWKLVVQAVEAVVPPKEEEESAEVLEASDQATREELYEDVVQGARFDLPRIALIGVSAVVAAVGMVTDSVAVVIGAMVIAPLLGPILAMILGTALGEHMLILKASRLAGAGLAIAVAVGAVSGLVVDYDPNAGQIAARGDLTAEGVALALASGAAAALSLTTGVAAVLVGVMVAVALLPPAVAIGLFLGKGLLFAASGAMLLFFVNVAAVTVAGQLVFLLQGVRPRSWYKKKAAQQSVAISLTFWTVALVLLVALDYLRSFLGGGS